MTMPNSSAYKLKLLAPLAAGIALLLIIIAFNVQSAFRQSGTFTYPLDDTYIHMAISRNLASDGTWGISPGVFASTSSSVLYTLLLALTFRLFGSHEWIPLILNMLVSLSILIWLSRVAIKHMKPFEASVFLVAFVLLVPMPAMTVLGMEHTLQIGFSMVFLYTTYRLLQGDKVSWILYFLMAALAVMTRYELLFMTGIVAAIWLFLFRKGVLAFGLLAASALPVVLFGLYSLQQGGLFLPNSILAKSQLGSGGVLGFLKLFSKKILFNSLASGLLILPSFFFLRLPCKSLTELRESAAHMIWAIVGLTCIAHIGLANLGWMYRYEAYLLSLNLLALLLTYRYWGGMISGTNWLYKTLSVGFAFFLGFSILSRVSIIDFTNRAMKNIHDQQVQMARFVKTYYPNSCIAIGDIGAIAFYNPNVRILDLEGLASTEVLVNKKNMNEAFLASYAARNKAGVGILFTHLYRGQLPASWKLVGTWTLPDNYVAAGPTVGFYAIDPAEELPLRNHLKEFAPNLPKTVLQESKPHAVLKSTPQ